MRKAVISLCDRTGNMVKPWADAGYECICVDTQDGISAHANIFHLKTTVQAFEHTVEWLQKRLDVVALFAFPPCTDLAVSGARWFEQKKKADPNYRKKAMDVVYTCYRIARNFACPFFLENPISVISTEWRKPDYYFDPNEFGGYKGGEGDNYTKRTSLWVGGGFTLPPKKKIDATDGSRMWKMAGWNKEVGNRRSVTPMGFARAVFEHLTKGG